MKAWFNRLPRAAIIGIVISIFVLGIAATIVLAATGQITPVQQTANGVAPPTTTPPTTTATFSLYEADGVTPFVQPLVWGDVTIGIPKTANILIKNTGTATIGIAVDLSGVPSDWTLTATPVDGLAPGSSANMTLTLSTTVVGSVSFTTNFSATY